jgi:hypothetical protein
MIVMRRPRQDRLESVPSPARIRELTARIRKNWTLGERLRRANQTGFVELLEISVTPRWKHCFDD